MSPRSVSSPASRSPRRPKTARELVDVLLAGHAAEVPTTKIADALEWISGRCAGLQLDVLPGSPGYHLLTVANAGRMQ